MKAWTGIKAERPSKQETSFHQHGVVQIFYVQSGLMTLSTPQGSWVVPPGRLAFIKKGVKHASTTVSATAGWMTYLPQISGALDSVEISIIQSNNLLSALLERLAERKSLSNSAFDKNLKSMITHELKSVKTESMGLRFPASPNLRKVAEEIRWSMTKKKSVKELAKMAGMSERSFSRHFKDEVGTSFEKWRQAALNQKAIELLSKGQSVTEASMNVGYKSISAFIASFREEYGVSPLQYLKTA